MCYFKYQENLENVLADTYVEVDNDMVMRQISLTEDNMIYSNIKDNHYHFRLCDQEIDISDGQYVLITEEEFNGIWSKEMEKYLHRWETIKQNYKIGETVIGKIEVIYPQDIVIEIGYGIWAAVDYNECKKSKFDGFLSPQRKIKGNIVGYDEINMWIILKQVQVI